MSTATKANRLEAYPANGTNMKWFEKLFPGTWSKLETVWVGECVLEPVAALEVLEHHAGPNRPVAGVQLSKLKDDMVAGAWQLNGETIVFNSKGILVNGYHRMNACVKSDTDINVLIVCGVDKEAFETFDQHSRRTVGQVLTLKEEKNGNTLAAAVHLVACFCRSGQPLPGHMRRSTIHELVMFLEQHPDLRGHVAATKNNAAVCRMMRSHSAYATLAYLFSVALPEQAKDFFHRIGTMQIPDEPRYKVLALLMRRLMDPISQNSNEEGVRSSGKHRHRMTQNETTELVVRAWNMFCQGHVQQKLQLSGKCPPIHGIAYAPDGLPLIPLQSTIA